jgi:hypothetical protein
MKIAVGLLALILSSVVSSGAVESETNAVFHGNFRHNDLVEQSTEITMRVLGDMPCTEDEQTDEVCRESADSEFSEV